MKFNYFVALAAIPIVNAAGKDAAPAISFADREIVRVVCDVTNSNFGFDEKLKMNPLPAITDDSKYVAWKPCEGKKDCDLTGQMEKLEIACFRKNPTPPTPAPKLGLQTSDPSLMSLQ